MNKIIHALILCGGENKGTLLSETQVLCKALLPMAGKPMASHVFDALVKSNISPVIAVSGPPEIRSAINSAESKTLFFLESKNSMFENAMEGVKAVGTCDFVFIITADIPLVTAEMIQSFAVQCENTEQESDVYWPIVEKQYVIKKFPDAKRTYMKLKEGTFTGGNFALVKPAFFSANEDLFAQAIAFRKSPLRLMKLLGFLFVLKFFLGLLSISSIEKRISEILPGWKVKGMPVPHPEIGMDVDKIEDYKTISQVLEKSRITNCS